MLKWPAGPPPRPGGLEPPTYWFEASYSIQLSYGRFDAIILTPTLSNGNPSLTVRAPQREP